MVGSLRLPLRGRAWRGESGNWQGAGIGNSIDFQDHRPYLPGDDPRYIDWQAYARTGHYTMKLYREEVSPRVDLVVDVSESMLFDKTKRHRALELLYFAVESTLQSGSSLRCAAARGSDARPWSVESLLGYRPPPVDWDDDSIDSTIPAVERVAFRQGSLRVLVSDLLYPGSPESLLAALAVGKGRGLLLVPFAPIEVDPDWNGNVEFTECESGARRVQHVSPDVLTRYAAAYARHFALWTETARRHGAQLARFDAGLDFASAARLGALPTGALEWVH